MTEGMGMSGPARRFSLRIDPWWRPALFLIGLAGDRAWAELDSESLVVRFGFFRYRFARRSIAATPRSSRVPIRTRRSGMLRAGSRRLQASSSSLLR